MRKKRIPVDYPDKNLELQFKFVSVCMQACMIRKDHCANVIFTAADVELISFVLFMDAILLELCSLLTNTYISKLAAMAEEKSRQHTWRTYFSEKRTELFYSGYALFDGCFEKSVRGSKCVEAATIVLVEPFQTMLAW